MSKFLAISFERHCADWLNVMKSWVNIYDKLGNTAMEVDEVALARQPHRLCGELASPGFCSSRPSKSIIRNRRPPRLRRFTPWITGRQSGSRK
jgi:hypothetical protein